MIINGVNYEEETMDLMTFLKNHQMEAAHVVVEINQKIISKSAFEHCIIQKDDVVEIVSFVGGG